MIYVSITSVINIASKISFIPWNVNLIIMAILFYKEDLKNYNNR